MRGGKKKFAIFSL